MQEKLKDCEECDTLDVLRRIPSFSLSLGILPTSQSGGDRVKDFIEESRHELKEERENLKRKEYTND